jgi:uncharacterized RDD family membrane protein YckC
MEPLEYSIFPEKPVVYATFWTRFAALLIDSLILFFLEIIVNLIFDNSFMSLLINVITGWLYSAVLESGPNMATLGKKAVRIKVTDLNGQRITFGQATGRYFGKMIISTIILLLGFFMMLWDSRNQTLHDKMAGTLVVET